MWSFYLKKIFKTFLKLNKFKSLSMRKLFSVIGKDKTCFLENVNFTSLILSQ